MQGACGEVTRAPGGRQQEATQQSTVWGKCKLEEAAAAEAEAEAEAVVETEAAAPSRPVLSLLLVPAAKIRGQSVPDSATCKQAQWRRARCRNKAVSRRRRGPSGRLARG